MLISLVVLGRKIDNHSIPIVSDPDTYLLLFIYSDWFQTLSGMVLPKNSTFYIETYPYLWWAKYVVYQGIACDTT